MIPSKDMFCCLAWLFIGVLQFSSALNEPNYTTIPINTTVSMGKSTSFSCGVNAGSSPEKLNFVIRRPELNYTLTCPGNSVKYPSMSLYGRCDVSASVYTATWEVSNIAGDFNNTLFQCGFKGLNITNAYLFVDGSSKYFSMLFGCVMGGFFGILIVFGVTYVLLKRSERCQECFKGKPENQDPTITVTREY